MTAFAEDMLIYDEGNVYSCSIDHLESSLKAEWEKRDDEGKGFQLDPISHKEFEDLFYEPMACPPMYRDRKNPIWFGRVENMQPVNQKIFVYGFVTSPTDEDFEGGELKLKYQMRMRGKNTDDEIWTDLNPDAEFHRVKFECDGANELCTYFPVGFLPEIEYDMYDVAVVVEKKKDLKTLENTYVNFHIAWVNPDFTAY